MTTFLHRLVFSVCLGVMVWPGTAATPLPYQNPKEPIEVRLQDLLSRMTLEEKIAQLNLWPNLAELLKHKSIADDIDLTLRQITNGVGAIEYDTKLPIRQTFHRSRPARGRR